MPTSLAQVGEERALGRLGGVRQQSTHGVRPLRHARHFGVVAGRGRREERDATARRPCAVAARVRAVGGCGRGELEGWRARTAQAPSPSHHLHTCSSLPSRDHLPALAVGFGAYTYETFVLAKQDMRPLTVGGPAQNPVSRSINQSHYIL